MENRESAVVAKYRVTSPDGQTFEVTAPDAASQEEVMAYAKKNMQKETVAPKRPDVFKNVSSEFLKGMTQGGLPAAVVRGMGAAIPPIAEYQAGVPYRAGGAVTDIAAKTGLPPEVSGAIGYGTNVGLQSIGMLGGGELVKPLAIPLKKISDWSSKELMGSALKPSASQWATGEGDVAIKTMLEKNLNVSKGGILALRSELGTLQNKVSDAIAKSGKTVPKADVSKTIAEAMSYFKGGTGEISDLKIIKDVIKEFESAPSVKGLKDIPVQVAQRMKQLEYRRLDKAYGVLGDAEETARKGTARGLKEGIEKQFPEVKGWNAEEQKIYKTLPIVERRAMMEINRNPGGLALLTQNPSVAAIFMGDKSSAFKSWLANRINQSSQSLPVATRALGQAGVSLGEIGSGVGTAPEMSTWNGR